MNPVAVAAKGKGTVNAARRAGAIGAHYGATPAKMERRLEAFLQIMDRAGAAATLPITAAALHRNPRVPRRFADLGIEFAVHGLYHVDHISLDVVTQDRHVAQARRLFEDARIAPTGFRAPYLRWNEGTIHALIENGFVYDCSQSMHHPIAPELETDAYRRVLKFYSSIPAAEHPVLPRLENGLVRMPVCLPDDESVVDRLALAGPGAIAELWLDVWRRTHARGELFTMQIHPERIEPCGPGIAAVLDAARAAAEGVWVARLDQIAAWWLARAGATVQGHDLGGGRYRVAWSGPPGLSVSVHGAPRAESPVFEITSYRRPFIGVHPSSAPGLARYLREQGYVNEIATSPATHTLHLRHETFERADELPVLREIQAHAGPLVRIGRWPDGARSAIAVTGDVDALTIWDYALRVAGR